MFRLYNARNMLVCVGSVSTDPATSPTKSKSAQSPTFMFPWYVSNAKGIQPFGSNSMGHRSNFLFYDGPHEHIDFGVRPVTSKIRDFIGNKDCTHWNFKGTLLYTNDWRAMRGYPVNDPEGYMSRFATFKDGRKASSHDSAVYFKYNVGADASSEASPPTTGNSYIFAYLQGNDVHYLDGVDMDTGVLVTGEPSVSKGGDVYHKHRATWAEDGSSLAITYSRLNLNTGGWGGTFVTYTIVYKFGEILELPDAWKRSHKSSTKYRRCDWYTYRHQDVYTSWGTRNTGQCIDTEVTGTNWLLLSPVEAPDMGTFDGLLESLERLLKADLESCDFDPSFSELTEDAISNTRLVKTNMITFAGDVIQLPKMVKHLFKGIREIPKDPRALADLYLNIHYGFMMFVKDLQTISETDFEALLNSQTRSIERARKESQPAVGGKAGFTWGYTKWLKAYLRYTQGDVFTDFSRALWRLGAAPTADQLWDLIPFSFVVDWFVKVQDALETDAAQWVENDLYETESCICTSKATTIVDVSRINFMRGMSGTLTASLYQRRVHDSLPPMSVRINSATTFDHFFEGTSLIVSGIRRR